MSSQQEQFPYKKVLVLGATSGIGEALARRIVESGAYVIAVGRRKENLDKLVHEYGHEKMSSVPFDISNLNAIPNFVKGIVNTHPDLDYVLFNSGIQRKCDFSDPENVDLSDVNAEWITNYLSYLTLTKGFLPHFMSKGTETGLCYVTSGLAIVPLPRCSNYCATKAALHQWIISTRHQLSKTNVKVYELLPPAVQTELHDTKHQPDIKDGGNIGMPLKDFTDEAFAGLAAKKESVAVGFANMAFENIEPARQKAFQGMLARMPS